MARASGVNYDIRKVDKYSIYDRFSFRIPLGAHGDVYDRYMIRFLEMRESLKILNDAMRDIPGGPIVDPKMRIRGFRPTAGEAYGRIGSRHPRASLASTSSATARRTRTAIAFVRPASSI